MSVSRQAHKSRAAKGLFLRSSHAAGFRDGLSDLDRGLTLHPLWARGQFASRSTVLERCKLWAKDMIRIDSARIDRRPRLCGSVRQSERHRDDQQRNN